MSFIHDVCISFRDSRTPNSSRSSSASSVSHIESNGPFNDLEESPGLISNEISDYVESSNDNEEDDIVSNYPIFTGITGRLYSSCLRGFDNFDH